MNNIYEFQCLLSANLVKNIHRKANKHMLINHIAPIHNKDILFKSLDSNKF